MLSHSIAQLLNPPWHTGLSLIYAENDSYSWLLTLISNCSIFSFADTDLCNHEEDTMPPLLPAKSCHDQPRCNKN